MRPLCVLGIDGAGCHPLRRWIEQGKLPGLQKILTGANRKISILDNQCFMRTESAWLTFLQGMPSTVSQEWAHCTYDHIAYAYAEKPAYGFDAIQPFFRNLDLSTLVFDLPLVSCDEQAPSRIHSGCVEIYGWGTESNQILSSSCPAQELPLIRRRYGRHPVYSSGAEMTKLIAEDSDPPAIPAVSQYRLPNIYRSEQLIDLRDGLVAGVRLRTEIIADLLKRHQPELAICVFAEAHTAGHMFWHLSQPHPLFSASSQDLMLDVFQEIDTAIGRLVGQFGQSDFVVFSPQGMQSNFIELSSSAFLPEMLFRFSSDQWILGGDQSACRAADFSSASHWKNTVFGLVNPALRACVDSPDDLEVRGDALSWSPARWYQPLWPHLTAFALPSYSEGLVRLNVRGRDGATASSGQIDPCDYNDHCGRISSELLAWTDVQSGRRIVADVLRTRATPFDASGPLGSLPADLLVRWREPVITNHIVHPEKGTIGPLPYFRTGAHCCQGMIIDLCRDGLSANRMPSTLSLMDVAACLQERCAVARE